MPAVGKYAQKVFPGIAQVDVYREVHGGGHLQLDAEDLLLLRFEFPPLVVVQAYFAYCHYAFGLVRLKSIQFVAPSLVHGTGVQPQHLVDHARMPVAERPHRRAFAGIHVGLDHLVNPGFQSPLQRRFRIWIQPLVVKVSMSVHEHKYKYSYFI